MRIEGLAKGTYTVVLVSRDKPGNTSRASSARLIVR
jgi:hypothetical protein